MSYNVSPNFTFRGYIPDGSSKIHVGIVLNAKDPIVKYCYCTSKEKGRIINEDFVHIPKENMAGYFENPRETFIYISPQHIIDMLIITFVSRLDNEYDVLLPIDSNIFIAIMNKIRNSNNLSERFKKEFFEFME